MVHNFWSLSEILERAKSGEIESSELGVKWSYLNYGEYCTVNCLYISNPKGIPLHVHKSHDEILEVLDGRCKVVIGNERRLAKKGDIFFIPKGIPHKISMTCTLLSIYSPCFDPDKPDRVFLEK